MPARPGSSPPTPVAGLPTLTLARDHVPQEVAARIRAGSLRRVGRGSYVAPRVVEDARRAALARIAAVHQQLRGAHVFSHSSAALLWGLPLWTTPAAVHVYQAHRPGARRDRRVQRHLGILAPAAVSEVAGLPVTSLAQTAVDCARTLAPLAGLVVVDAALRAGATTEGMLEIVDGDPRGRGMARAHAVIQLGDAGAESAQESAVRFVLLRAGLPQPRTQVEVGTRLGTFWADLGWEEWRVLLEYDGRVKYQDQDSLIREKRRQDAVTEAGWRSVRVTREDLRGADLLVARTLRLLPAGIPLTRRPLLRGR